MRELQIAVTGKRPRALVGAASLLFVGHQIGYAATAGPINLTNAPVGTLDSAADWNPNGSELVFARSIRVGNSVLEVINEGGGSPTPLPTNNDAWANPKFSPDGNLIVADEKLLSSGDIWTMASLGGGFLPLTHLDSLSVGHPAWQPIPPPVNTPTGFNIHVTPTDQNPAQPVGTTPVEVFFDQ